MDFLLIEVSVQRGDGHCGGSYRIVHEVREEESTVEMLCIDVRPTAYRDC
jgi:mRNA-degrading endonuclease RelE of RelBE toxin-antitoxin system